MITHKKPPLTGFIVRNGGFETSQAVVAQKYSLPTENAIAEYAANKLVSRFRFSISTARLYAHLSGLGGRD